MFYVYLIERRKFTSVNDLRFLNESDPIILEKAGAYSIEIEPKDETYWVGGAAVLNKNYQLVTCNIYEAEIVKGSKLFLELSFEDI